MIKSSLQPRTTAYDYKDSTAMQMIGRLLLATVLAFAPASGEANEPPAYQQILNAAVGTGVPGVQAVVIQGAGEWSGVAGLASVERGELMTAQTRIRVASITKMITYATIMELARQERLALSDRAIDRLPPGTLDNIPNAERITITQLLEHTSGLHNFNGPNGADFFDALYRDPERGARIWTAAELIAFAARPDNRPVNAPGERRDYSSTGYIILEMIAEHVSSEPLPALYKRLFFRPFGMGSSGFEGYDLRAVDIADSYGRPSDEERPLSAFSGRGAIRADGLVNLSRGLSYFNAWARGAGAVAATACDLSRFMRGVRDGRATVISGQANEFAAARGRPLASFSWNGGAQGIQASILYAPASDITVIVLINGSNAGQGSLDMARALLAAARATPAQSPLSAPCAPASSALDALHAVARDYERVFRSGDVDAFARVFAANGSYLTLSRPPASTLAVRRFSDAFDGWIREPDPLASVEVDEISMMGERMALMRLRLHYRGRVYLDQLSLYRFDTGWRIVAKQTQAG